MTSTVHLFEEIADTGSPKPRKQFDELRAGDGKERNAGLPGYGLGQESFAWNGHKGRMEKQRAQYERRRGPREGMCWVQLPISIWRCRLKFIWSGKQIDTIMKLMMRK
jgi:hypothetical protein